MKLTGTGDGYVPILVEPGQPRVRARVRVEISIKGTVRISRGVLL